MPFVQCLAGFGRLQIVFGMVASKQAQRARVGGKDDEVVDAHRPDLLNALDFLKQVLLYSQFSAPSISLQSMSRVKAPETGIRRSRRACLLNTRPF